MLQPQAILAKRESLRKELIGGEIPRLWCPTLTHYRADGTLDKERMAAHWVFMQPYVRAFLVPGSTGDGWEMSNAEINTLLDFALELADKLDLLLLVGVLKTDVDSTVEAITATVSRLKQKTGEQESFKALKQSRVCGFTVCPPRGADLTQEQMQADLATILELNLPTAIYQLPQVTENEMFPALIQQLAEGYGNFMLFKDSSGSDRFALEDRGKSGIFLLRGAEGNYADWLRESGGAYDGLLLSTANCFAAQLKGIVALLRGGKTDAARNLSDRLTRVLESVFGLVNNLPQGNPFTNANKAIDHFMAYGLEAGQMPPPMLHSGKRLPKEIMQEVGNILENAELIPQTGYLIEARRSHYLS